MNLLTLFFTRVAHNSHATDKPVALEFPIELEFRNVDFCGGRKTGEPGEKPSEQGREPTTNSTLKVEMVKKVFVLLCSSHYTLRKLRID